MKAVRYYAPGNIRVEDVPMPTPKANEALIKVLYSGICGSDLHIYRLGMFMTYAPETLGHEFVGKVVQAPSDSGFEAGDIVTGNPGVYCGECASCQKGDFLHCENLTFIGEVCPGCDAEYLVLPAEKLVKFAPDVDLLQASVVEPLTVAHHACKIAKSSLQGEAVVFGCGPIGLLIAYLLKNIYQIENLVLVDTNIHRRKKAEAAGFDKAYASITEAEQMHFATIIDTTGAGAALEAEINALTPRGVLVVVSVFEKLPTIDLNVLVSKEIQIWGSNAYTFEDMQETVKIIDSKKYDFTWLISHVIPCTKAGEAFAELAESPHSLKILFDFTD